MVSILWFNFSKDLMVWIENNVCNHAAILKNLELSTYSSDDVNVMDYDQCVYKLDYVWSKSSF